MTAEQLFSSYGSVIIEFLFELYVFFFLITFRLAKKSRFVLRTALSVAAVLALAMPIAAFYVAFGETVWGRTIVYLALFGLVFSQGLVLFDESVWTVLFCVSAAYAIQNLVYKVYLFQYFFGKLLGVYSFGSDVLGNFLYRLMYYAVFAVLAVAAWFLFIRRMRDKLSVERLNNKILLTVLAILLITVLLCSVEDIYFEQAGMSIFLTTVEANELFVLRQTGNAISIVCGVTVLFLMYKTLEERKNMRELEQLRHAIGQSEQQYAISKDTIKMINIKCHDIKYKLDAAINGSGINPEAFDDLRQSIAIYDSNIETGNKLLNVLFTEKSLYCERHGIKLSCMIDGERLDFMRDGDLYCLFGNILDNALEAVMHIKDREKRVINIVVKGKDDMVIVQADNFFAGDVKLQNGLPVTTKPDKDYHGFGLSSIKMITQTYGGEMVINANDDVFRLTLLFPMANGDEE